MRHLVGYVSGFLATFATVPQVVKSWRTRSVHDLSLPMLVLICSGVAGWSFYGWLESDWPIIIANAVSFALWGSLLWLKLRQRD